MSHPFEINMRSKFSSTSIAHSNAHSRAKLLSKAYGSFIDKTIIDFVSDAGAGKVELDEVQRYLTHHGFFITFSFYERSTGSFTNSSNSDNPLMIKLGHLFNLACRELLGPRYGKLKSEQPLCVAALDINCTRYTTAPSEVRNAHLHTIWVAQPGTADALFSFMSRVREDGCFSSFGFKDIDIQPISRFEPNGGAASILGSYTMKFLGRNTDQLVYADDFRIFPRRAIAA